jgi:hypothetical protein
MTYPGIVTAPRRSMLAGSTSLVLHGGLLLLAFALVGERVSRSPRLRLSWVEVAAPSPLPSPVPEVAAPAAPPAVTTPSARTPARQGHDTRRPPSRVPAPPESLADLRVSYDDPNNFTSKSTAETTIGGDTPQSAIGAIRKQLDDNLAALQVPVPAPVSLAQPPRPKRDYHRLQLRGVRRFAGLTIKVLLRIDAHGKVSDVRLLQGVDSQLDRRTIDLARSFEFEPARDEAGNAVPGSSKWDIMIVDDDHGAYRNALERGFY